MARVRNQEDYTIKKQQILAHAVNLLSEIGYEKLSINKVIESSGMTKGAFFHYYSSKKDLIDSIIRLLLDPIMAAFNQIVDDKALSPRQKIKAMFASATELKTAENELVSLLANLLYKEENQTVLHMITKDMLIINLPTYEKVIREGVDKGDFAIENSHGAAFMFLTTVIALNEELGRTIYCENSSIEDWRNLYDKLMHFERYAKGLFGFEDEVNLYGNSINLIKKLLNIKNIAKNLDNV